nr:nijmegen breakage syndrome 1 protein-like [Ziziphus jujuba var. spinosa]
MNTIYFKGGCTKWVGKAKSSSSSCEVLVRDCSKYSTFINKNLGSKEEVHRFPNKETTLRDGDLELIMQPTGFILFH